MHTVTPAVLTMWLHGCLKTLLIGIVAMGDDSQMSNSSGWTKSDVMALLALIIGLPAAFAAVIFIKRDLRRQRGELPIFALIVSLYPRSCRL